MKRKIWIVILIVLAALAAVVYSGATKNRQLVLTGVVTTDDVIVSSEIQGRLQRLLVNEGDTVTNGQLLAVIQPAEQEANLAFYKSGTQQIAAQVTQAEADLRYQQLQTSNLVLQSEANLAAAREQVSQAQADLENAQLDFQREEKLHRQGVDSVKEFDQARTTFESAKAKVEALRKQAAAAEAAVALAKSTGEQIPARQAALQATLESETAAGAQKNKAEILLGYTQIIAPTNGTVDVRAARPGEVVNPGQGILTLVDPQNLWVRADVEETYIDGIKLGDKFQIRLPSGATREGVVFYRGVDADFATQRDVSRTKRDIKTFEVRLRCNNDDHALAVGMTATVVLDLHHS